MESDEAKIYLSILDTLIMDAKQKKYIPLPEWLFLILTDYETLKMNNISNGQLQQFFKHYNLNFTSRRKESKFKATIAELLNNL